MAPGMNLHSYRAGGAWTVAQSEHEFFPPALSYVVNEYDYHLGRRSIPQLSLAYWFLVSLYLPAWGTLPMAWHRRKGRLMKATGLG